MSGDMGSAWSLTRIVGRVAARRLLLRPGKVTAAQAQDLGLVDEVAADLPAATDAVARRLAGSAPLAVAGVLANIADSELPWEDYLEREVPRMVACSHSEDAREAAAAFLEKCPPAFAGS